MEKCWRRALGAMKNEAERAAAAFGMKVCALCGYERIYAIKVLGGKRSLCRKRSAAGYHAGGVHKLTISSTDFDLVQACCNFVMILLHIYN